MSTITGGLLANVFYFIVIGKQKCYPDYYDQYYLTRTDKSVIGAPLAEWKNTTCVERNTQYFKQLLCMEADVYSRETGTNVNRNTMIMTSTRRTVASMNRNSLLIAGASYRSLPKRFAQTMQYIEEVLLAGNSDSLTKTEVEMLLLRVLRVTMYYS